MGNFVEIPPVDDLDELRRLINDNLRRLSGQGVDSTPATNTNTTNDTATISIDEPGPAENVSTVSATVTYNGGDRWGLNITVAFGASRANIARAVVIVRGPTNFGVSVDRNAYEFVPPASGNYSTSIGGEWFRAGVAHNFVVLVQTYNAQGEPTGSPISSSTITVNPIDNTVQATATSATAWYETTADGLGVFGFNVGFTQANIDTSHTEIWLESYDSGAAAYRREQLYTQTGPGGDDNGFAISGKGDLVDATPVAAQNIRLTFYTITGAGNRKSSPPQIVVSVSAQTGALKMNRADAATIGDGISVSGGLMRVTDLSISTAKLAALSVTAAKLGAASVETSKIAALAVTAAELATSSVTATKIANLAVGSAAIANLAVGNAAIANLAVDNSKIADLAVSDAKIANATITSAKIVSLVADKITAGTITASVSMTSPTIISTGGGGIGTVTLGAGIVKSESGNYRGTLGSGTLEVRAISTGDYSFVNPDGFSMNRGTINRVVAFFNGTDVVFEVKNASNIYTFQVGSSNCDLTNIPLRMNAATVINTAGQFVGTGVDVGTNGVNAVGYNVNGGFFGQTSLSLQIVTDVRINAGVTEKKTRIIDIRGGVVTSIGAESAWTVA